MGFVVDNIKWIMLVSGVLTCTMLMAAISPQRALKSSFGETLEGPAADVVVRNWGALIALIGGMLIYGAFEPTSRQLVLTVAGVSKLIFIGLVLSKGRRFMKFQAGTAVYADGLMVVLYAMYLAGAQIQG